MENAVKTKQGVALKKFKFAKRFLAVATLGAGLIGVGSAQPAGAFCQGVNSGWTLSAGNPVWGQESVRVTSTCDNLNDYFGKMRDTSQDGYCLYIHWNDVGGSLLQSIDCGNNTWKNTALYDNNNNTTFDMCRGGGFLATCASTRNNTGY
ncbi:MAG: hypothetical protein ACSLFB_02960 [Acidimicrobiales bacterium]